VTHELEDSPLVSVIMPARNAEKSLAKTLKSLECQTYGNWELRVTDDASTDQTSAIIHDWAGRVRQPVTVLSADGGGPSAARNLAAQEARGSLFAFLDADDVWHKEKLTEQIDALRSSPGLLGVTCDYAIVDGPTGQVSKRIAFDWSDKVFHRWIIMEGNGPALCSTLLLRSDDFYRIGGFDASLWNLEDVDIAVRLGAPHTLGSVARILCEYVTQPNQNHQQMETVRAAVNRLRAKTPFSTDGRLARRLKVNLRLLETARSFRRTRSLRLLGDLALTWVQAPITVTRTIIRTTTR